MDFQRHLKEVADKLTVALDQLIPPAAGPEANLLRAMRHAALANTRRIRAFYTLEVGRMLGAREKSLLRAAAAVECVHAYGLVHDALPGLENEDFRRGQPTVHRAFNETTAVLAGDGLNTLAYKILANRETHEDPGIRLQLIERLADASGAQGMVGGQMIDMLGSDMARDLNTLTRMQRMKTGALISYAAEAGAILGDASQPERNALAGFSHDLGLAFQIADDLLDAEGRETLMGRRASEGAKRGQPNFVSLLGADGANERIDILAGQAKEHLAIFRERADTLLQSVEIVLGRETY